MIWLPNILYLKTLIDVIIITDQPPFVNDGVGDYSYNLFAYLKNENYNIEVICRKDVCKKLPNYYSTFTNSWSFRDLKLVSKFIIEKKPKWILLQYVPYAFSKFGVPFQVIYFLLIIRLSGIKVQTNFHEISIRIFGCGVFGFFRAIAQRATAYLICLLSNKILTSNSYYASLLQPFKVAVIPVPSNFESLLSTEFENDEDNKNKIVITSTANRCYETFFEIIKSLTNNSLDTLTINITGRADAEDLNRINHLIQKYSLGKIVNCNLNLLEKEYCAILNRTNIFLHLEYVSTKGAGGVSSKSGVISTAMAFGLPIVTTCGDMTDNTIFRNKENLIFVPHDNPVLVADEIQSLITNLELRNILSNNAKVTYKDYMKLSNSIKYYLKFLS